MIEKNQAICVIEMRKYKSNFEPVFIFCCNTATKIKEKDMFDSNVYSSKSFLGSQLKVWFFFNLYVYLSKVSLCIYCGTHLFKQFLFLIHSFFLFSYKHCLPNCLYDDDDDDDGYQQHRHHFERFINIMENSDNSVFLFWFWFVSVFFLSYN